MLDKIRYITCPSEAHKVAQQLSSEAILGIDVETHPLDEYKDMPRAGLDPYLSRPRLLQAAVLDGRVAVFDLHHIPVELLQPLAQTKWAVFNGDFEYQHLTHAGLSLPRLHDVMLMDRLVSHELRSLDTVTADVLGLRMDKALQTSDWAGELSTAQIEYAAFDALATVRAAHSLLSKINHQRKLYDLWCGVLPVLAGLSLDGQTFDWDAHTQLSEIWTDEKRQLTTSLHKHLGAGVNPNSGPQLGEWLAQHLDSKVLGKWPKTPTGKLKTNADTLSLFANLPVVQPLLQYKAVSKLLSTYDKGYSKYKHPVTGKLHTAYRIGFTRSGRIAAQRPNNQNPPRLEAFRKLFIPSNGKVFVGADFSQIELRVAALLSGDIAMINAYRSGIDLHTKTASTIAGTDDITGEMRRAAKAVNFGNLYGQGPAGLARTAQLSYGASMTTKQARDALRAFNKAYPQLYRWKNHQVATAQVTRKVTTKSGLIRDFDIQGQGFLQGEAQNIPVQGAAAEILMATLVRIPDTLADTGGKLYHNVHDELIIEVPPENAVAVTEKLSQAMTAGFMDIFPEGEVLTHNLIDIKTGSNWAQVH